MYSKTRRTKKSARVTLRPTELLEDRRLLTSDLAWAFDAPWKPADDWVPPEELAAFYSQRHVAEDGHDDHLSGEPNGQVLDAETLLELVGSAKVCFPEGDASLPEPEFLLGDGGVFETYPLSQTFQLHSKPDSNYKIYLDYDGHTTSGTSWNGGATFSSYAYSIDGDRTTFNDTERTRIQRVWARVAEDFMPFDVDVTTEEPPISYLTRSGASDPTYGVRVVISQDNAWLGSAPGGIAYLNSFADSTDEPVFVFNASELGISEAVSHEVGHALSLSHDGQSPSTEYYAGHGSGATGWAPIMGVGYYKPVTTWSKGEYNGATQTQDDLARIINYIPYRDDDYGSTRQTAQELTLLGGTTIDTTFGIIERNTDLDVFSFLAGAGAATITIDTLSIGANLDVQARLLDADGAQVAFSNPPAALGASFSLNLPAAGRYFLELDGVGFGDPATNGYSDYSSLGNYRITGDVQPMNPLRVDGGAGDDLIQIDLSGAEYVVTVNGSSTSYSPALITEINVFGGGGWNRLEVVGSAEAETVVAGPGTLTLTNSGLTLSAQDTHEIQIAGNGGADTAALNGTADDDAFLLNNSAQLSRDGVFLLDMSGFGELAVAGGGGWDTAELEDWASNDTWEARPGWAQMSGGGKTATLTDFEEATAVAANGGTDTARFSGSGAADLFDAYHDHAVFAHDSASPNYHFDAVGFEIVVATADQSADRAVLHDSDGNDSLRAYAASSRLFGSGFDLRANGFSLVSAYADQGGQDEARLYGSSAAEDLFVSGPSWARLQENVGSPSYRNEAYDFDVVVGTAAGVGDTAILYDSNLADEVIASPAEASIRNGVNLDVSVQGFSDVTFHAVNGGWDSAELRGSVGDDLFSSGPAYAYLTENVAPANRNFMITTRKFEQVRAFGRGGADVAKMYDSNGNDLFYGRRSLARLSGPGFSNEVNDFADVTAYGVNGGVNTRNISALDYVFRQVGSWKGFAS